MINVDIYYLYVRQVMDNKNFENVEPQQKNATREESEDDVLLREMVRILVFDGNTFLRKRDGRRRPILLGSVEID